jgi:hypothetical protein
MYQQRIYKDTQMKQIKMAIGVALAVIWGAVFLVMPAHAFIDDAQQNGSMESKSTVDAEGRGVANFTMSFSGSATTKGNFDGQGMMQDIFNADNTPYYYQVK